MKTLKRFFSIFSARDMFVLVGFIFLYRGLSVRFGNEIAMIAIGAIILIKGLTKWV